MNQHKKLFTKNVLILIVFLLMAIPASLYLYNTTVYASLSHLNLTPQPEKFTELYINNHTDLPRSVEINTPNSFSFTIHNLEYQPMKYDYEVYIEDIDGNRSYILKDSVALQNDEEKRIIVAYVMVEEVKRAKVVVNLINKNQEVHYWIGARAIDE